MNTKAIVFILMLILVIVIIIFAKKANKEFQENVKETPINKMSKKQLERLIRSQQ
jgi:Na+-transporting methylmalonyl-CoA/oxaloacetate decarboxylase gamma subunit